MPAKEVSPKKMMTAVQHGMDRLRNFRASRLMYIRQYCGQYYDRDHGTIGDEPLNLIFNAIAIIVPNLVANFPKNVVLSRFMQYRGYAELLALGLDYLSKEIDIKSVLRRWVVDSLFTIGIIKTGLATSKDLVTFSDDQRIDAGQPYAETVDFDDWVLDPAARHIEERTFVGNRIRAPRQMMLDSGLYKNDLVEKLPTYGQDSYSKRDVEMISQHELTPTQISDLQDYVEVVELWVPEAKATVTIPAGRLVLDDYLRVDDYYGPDEGPYSYLALTPPVPNNPLPVAPVGIWHDLHVQANKMAKKVIDQAARQKTVLGYKRVAADDAQEVVDAGDGEAIAMDDPQAVQSYRFGGQEQSNEAHLQQLSYWFSLMSGNTDQLGGLRTNSDTATGQEILQTNGNVRLEDMRDLVYAATAEVERKLAWYLHTDPLIALPLIKRVPIPAQTAMTAYGPMLMQPAQITEQQVILSPDVRTGEFLDFHFSIEAKSMSRLDPAMRLQKALMFASKVLPAAAAAAQVCTQMGVPFSFSKFAIRMGKELDLDWLDEVFYDPEFQMQMAELLARSPQIKNSKGMMSGAPISPGSGAVGLRAPQEGAASIAAVNQNGGAANGANIPTPVQDFRANAQQGANAAQSARTF
jgi:hypothetical protein